MSNLKLGVEVVGAHDLNAKDGQGSCNPCVELHFDHQKFRTTIKEKDLNPYWNELFYFNISDPSSVHDLKLEATVYHINKATQSKSAIGKVQIAGTSFVSLSDAVTLYYPLEKNHVLSRTRGELGLKVFLTDDPLIRSSIPLPDTDPFQTYQSQPENPIPNSTNTHKEGIFHHLPREQTLNFAADEMRSAPARATRMFSPSSSQQPLEFQLKETRPNLGGGQVIGGRVIPSEKPSSTYDLVEKVEYLFVRVVKARDLPNKDITGRLDPYVEVRLGNYKGTTKHFEKKQNPEWDEVFAFPSDKLQSSVLEVSVKDKDLVKDDFVGMVVFDLNDIPKRVPPDSPLAPEWYWLVDRKGGKAKGELMLAVWIGTQADECFPIATHSDATTPSGLSLSSQIRSKVYHAPRLWYVRLNIIEAQDIIIPDRSRFPDVYVKCQLGNQVLKTRKIQASTFNPMWNEDLMFVAGEPFEEPLILTVLDSVSSSKEETIGRVQIQLSTVEKRADDRIVNPRWYSLEKHAVSEGEQSKKEKFSSRLHVRVCLDGGYHVLDESTLYSSDLRPTAKQLWKHSIGLLELGILNADGLQPMKAREGKGTCDTYCVAKYGQKWVRTRTILNSLSPRYNEQYTWEVYDIATVVTVGVFDNSQLEKAAADGGRDQKIGKVRIRLSTLEAGRVYTHSYPLLVLDRSGLKKMGELHLAIRFSSTSLLNTMLIYSKPLLPKMHYLRPLPMVQLDMLRHHAVQIVAARLSRMEPPLRKEVVEYMSDVESHLWSMRRSKANFFRLMSVFSGLFAVGRWFSDVCWWKNPITTVLVHLLFVMLVCFPELIAPTVFLYLFLIGVWNYRRRPRYPPHMNTRISHAEGAPPDELDEEFDGFPTSSNPELVKIRYDRLRSVAGRIQTVVGDIATQGERLQGLLGWRDPRATSLFLGFCLAAAVVLYVTPFSILAVVSVFYLMRHPMFRQRLPSAPVNFFRRLPAKTDSLL
ncbi:hypothetical protein HPP92_022249 [Vanilla planifolia]|uniref:C2 domain-containing protein n=1 Tax=Vanilla planifolia TaxID=51239 RepID=A0A835PVC2_VANPL|nr:hypothetical protein HPP92_022249 [Vanilla planifolia]